MKLLALVVVLGTGCASTRVTVDPVKVQPIHVKVDVHVHDQPAHKEPSAERR